METWSPGVCEEKDLSGVLCDFVVLNPIAPVAELVEADLLPAGSCVRQLMTSSPH